MCIDQILCVHRSREPTPVGERHLAPAIAGSLSGATVEKLWPVPGWRPMPGRVDISTSGRDGGPGLVAETKLKDGDQLIECLSDLLKVVCLRDLDGADAACLVAGTTQASWAKPIACADLFGTGSYKLVEAIKRRHETRENHLLAGEAVAH